MTNVESKISILMLIGLPGSGKTTFSKYLAESLENPTSLCVSRDIPVHYVIVVCYDKIITPSFHKGSREDVKWSEARKSVLKAVENMVVKLKKCTDPIELAEQHNFRTIVNQGNVLPNSRILIIIDDNMYYRSMRYQYYQIARAHTLGFCQLYFKCDVSESVRRNEQRDIDDVPVNIIFKMAKNMEEPNTCENPWEKFSISIMSKESFTPTTVLSVYNIIEQSFTCPVAPILLNFSEGELSKAVCFSNVSHQVDLALRKIIGNEMKMKRCHLSPQEAKSLSKTLNDKRQLILQHIKSGELVIPENTCVGIEEANPSGIVHLYTFLLQQFSQ